MKTLLSFLGALALLAGCAVSTDGVVSPARPVAAQGSNDVQGNPVSVPGAGMGVGSGSTRAVGSGSGVR